ncbi:hypothetical protein [Novispirillum itersonii]|uniref:Lipoprotein n=1 Tax=Novispirillum itersonii TaxID=189 RepID=A0A7W9ZKA4_NOVIT|nr:hypothetical protein [Novispirillum itersonii]MBB6211799.1 hypothetical protein [Novispirillum itersonii]
MQTAKTLILNLFLAFTVSACGAVNRDTELPKNGTGSDEMKPSPCACQPIPWTCPEKVEREPGFMRPA